MSCGLRPSPPGARPRRRARSPAKMSLNYFDNMDELKGGDSILPGGYNQVCFERAAHAAARSHREKAARGVCPPA